MRRIRILSTALLLASLLCGCSLFNAEQFYCLPDAPDAYYTLQTALSTLIDSGCEYLAPLSGGNQEPVQLIDLDGDGTDEAVACLRSSEDGSAFLCVLSETEASFEVVCRMPCAGTVIDAVEYCDLSGDGDPELLVTSRAGDSGPSVLQVFSGTEAEPLLETVCGSYETTDLSGDGGSHLVTLADGAAASAEGAVLTYYIDLTTPAAVTLSMPIARLISLETGTLADGQPCLVATGTAAEEDGTVIDVLCADGDSLKRIAALETDAPKGNLLIPRTVDGFTELPILEQLPAYSTESTVQYQVSWNRLSADGGLQRQSAVYDSWSNGWSMTLPESWDGTVTVHETSRAEQECMVTETAFYRMDGDRPGELQLSVFTITGTGCQQYAADQQLTVLYTAGETVVAVRLNEEAEIWEGTTTLAQVSEALGLIPNP